MNYAKEILTVLLEAGTEGLSVHKIAIHVHNAHNTLFSPVAFEEVRHNVQMWLLKNSRHTTSPVAHCEKRGMYRLNLMSKETRQMLFEFGESSIQTECTGTKDKGSSQKQPTLFDQTD